MGDVGPNLFCYAFSCLVLELAKMYFWLTLPREFEAEQRRRAIGVSRALVLALCCVVTARTAAMVCVLLLMQYAGDAARYDGAWWYVSTLDFYGYGSCCLLLGLWFLRFALPLYHLYHHIVRQLQLGRARGHRRWKGSMSSDLDARLSHTDDFSTTQQQQQQATKGKEQEEGVVSLALGRSLFVQSMKRTWLMALYCGVAFICRAVVILAASEWLENNYFVFLPYYLGFEIVPNALMLYIYHRSTQSMLSNV